MTLAENLLVVEVSFEDLVHTVARTAGGAGLIRRLDDTYYLIGGRGEFLELVIARDGPKEEMELIEYDLVQRKWKGIRKGEAAQRSDAIYIPVLRTKELAGPLGSALKHYLKR
jgi:hypothetical protein